ncbi:MAG: IPT/TIG domain-containing protein, partial [Promethearchaeia archaeon]
MRCTVSSGIGKDLAVLVNVSGQESARDPNAIFSYERPKVTAIGFRVGPSTGHPALDVYGVNFGASLEHSDSLTASVGGKMCSSVLWSSDTALRCSFLGGHADAQVDVAVTLSNQTSVPNNATSLFLVQPPNVTAVQAMNRSSAGFVDDGGLIEIYGSNFGDSTSSRQVAVGFSDCRQTEWLSTSTLQCTVFAGMGVLHPVSVQVNAGASTLPRSFNYTIPVIQQASPDVLHPDNAGSTFNAAVTLIGANFGLHDYTPMVRVGGTSCTSSKWISASAVTCRVPAGVGGKLDVVVSISRAFNTLLESVSYAPPTITAIKNLSVAHSTSGSATLTVLGAGMGAFDHNASDVVVGDTRCTRTVWQSATALKCVIPPGIGAGLKVAVRVSALEDVVCSASCGALAPTFKYEKPTLSAVMPTVGSSGGGDVVTLIGSGFGVHSYGDVNRT